MNNDGAVNGQSGGFFGRSLRTRPFILIGLVAGAVVVIVILLGSHHGVDTSSTSYGAGQSVGDQWAAVYGAATGTSANSDHRQQQCLNMKTIADASGYAFKTGHVPAGQVNEADFLDGCQSAIAARLGPAN